MPLGEAQRRWEGWEASEEALGGRRQVSRSLGGAGNAVRVVSKEIKGNALSASLPDVFG